MKSLLRGLVFAAAFALAGAFAASLWLEVRHETPASPPIVLGTWEGRRIRVEVLNGAGVDGLAWRATERLRRQGFDVVYFGNAADFEEDTSVAIARLGEIEPTRRVADVLGLRKVMAIRDESLYLDVTVIVGKDWLAPEQLTGDGRRGTFQILWGHIRTAAQRLWPG